MADVLRFEPVSASAPTPSEAWGSEEWLEVLVSVFQAGRQLRKVLAKFTHICHVNDSEFLLLWLCGHGGEQGVQQSELVGRLGLSPPQLSGLVYDVRDRGWIEMQRPAADRRRQVLRLTEAGHEVLRQTVLRLAPLLHDLEVRVTHAERQTCREFLGHLAEIEDNSTHSARAA